MFADAVSGTGMHAGSDDGVGAMMKALEPPEARERKKNLELPKTEPTRLTELPASQRPAPPRR